MKEPSRREKRCNTCRRQSTNSSGDTQTGGRCPLEGPRVENSGGTREMKREEREVGHEGVRGGNFLRVTNNRADSTDPRGAQSRAN